MNTKVKELEQYIKSPAVNQSTIKTIIDRHVHIEPKATSIHMLVGSFVDMQCTLPHLVDDFFVVEEDITVEPKIREIVEYVYVNYYRSIDKLDINSATYILEACEVLAWQPKWKDETKLDNILNKKNGPQYYDFLKKAEGRELITRVEYDKALEAYLYLSTNSLTRDFFDHDRYDFQVPVYADIKIDIDTLIAAKGLIDIRTKDKTKFYDLKVTDVPLSKFIYQARRFRLDIQMSYYYTLCKIDAGKGHIKLPSLIVYSFADNRAMIWDINSEDINAGTFGLVRRGSDYQVAYTVDTEDKDYLGWNDGLKLYKEIVDKKYPDYDWQYHRSPVLTDKIWRYV